MKNNIIKFLGTLFFLIIFSACDLGPYKVTFDTQGGASVDSQSVVKDGTVTKPVNMPYSNKLPNKYFDGWYTKASGGEKWDFNKNTVTSDVTIYAHWKDATIGLTYSVDGSTVTGCSDTISGELVIPAYNEDTKVTAIGSNAFQNQSSITSVFFPNTITTIGSSIFYKFPPDSSTALLALTQFTIQAVDPPLLGDTLDIYTGSSTTLKKIYVPADGYASYLSATYWKDWEDIIFKFE